MPAAPLSLWKWASMLHHTVPSFHGAAMHHLELTGAEFVACEVGGVKCTTNPTDMPLFPRIADNEPRRSMQESTASRLKRSPSSTRLGSSDLSLPQVPNCLWPTCAKRLQVHERGAMGGDLGINQRIHQQAGTGQPGKQMQGPSTAPPLLR